MDTKYEFLPLNEDRIAYVRPVAVADLPRDLQDQAGGAQMVYAVHNSDGKRLALVKDKRLAFVLARQNDLAPVHVH
ncbi:MAG: DUF1150 family protein [Paracoccaceae bacterium]